jgi:hypothetical protein
MAKPDIMGWFDNAWMPARERALKEGWESLARPDQVLLAVGFLLDSCVGDGVWAVVDGVLSGSDEGLTARMPEALEEVGLEQAAGYVRKIIKLRAPAGSPKKDEANRKKAIGEWGAIQRLFGEWVPGGERVMLTRLYDLYHARTTIPAEQRAAPGRGGAVATRSSRSPRRRGR